MSNCAFLSTRMSMWVDNQYYGGIAVGRLSARLIDARVALCRLALV